MKTLVLDTSSSILYFSFLDDNIKLYEISLEGKNNHSENLLKEIEIGLNKTNLRIKDFARIIVGIGPGSYTGLRVSLTVAKMFSMTNNIPLYTASSLDLLASGYLDKSGTYAITLHAKKDYVYGKLIKVDSNGYIEIIPDTFCSVDEFLHSVKDYDYELINQDNYTFNPIHVKISKVENLHSLTPNYLQKSV